ncbi:MAG: TlpA family protein disulfide reductase [Alphaproteobacteria bacterium]|nr:TlpA family protein disulfide reductase [Alphaproteobacteria bacterium]
MHRSSRIRKPRSPFLLIVGVWLLWSLPAEAGFIAPPIDRLPTEALSSAEGEAVRLDALAPKVLVVNFWATWCAPCVHELPTLAALSNAFGDRSVQVVLINEDIDFQKAEEFLHDFDFHAETLRLFDAGGGYLQAIGGRGLPITLIVDASGAVTHYAGGSLNWNAPEIHDLLLGMVPEVIW